MNIVMLGPPGSGKGTQSRNVAVLQSNVEVVDCGKLLRATALPDNLKNLMGEGFLIDDSVVINVVKTKLTSLTQEGTAFIIDGFPRSIKQTTALFSMLDELESNIACVVKLQIMQDVVIDRLSQRLICANCGEIFNIESKHCANCGSASHIKRKDDSSISAIKNRLEKYSAVEENIVKLFREKQIPVLSIAANKKIDEVTKDIKHQLLLFT